MQQRNSRETREENKSKGYLGPWVAPIMERSDTFSSKLGLWIRYFTAISWLSKVDMFQLMMVDWGQETLFCNSKEAIFPEQDHDRRYEKLGKSQTSIVSCSLQTTIHPTNSLLLD